MNTDKTGDEIADWADSLYPRWMELPTMLGGLLVEVVPATKEIVSVKWQRGEEEEDATH